MSGGEIRNKICVSYINIKRLVVPAWTAGTQVDMDVSGRVLRAWMPAIHAGTTEIADGQYCDYKNVSGVQKPFRKVRLIYVRR
jgi:hypothetical protein